MAARGRPPKANSIGEGGSPIDVGGPAGDGLSSGLGPDSGNVDISGEFGSHLAGTASGDASGSASGSNPSGTSGRKRGRPAASKYGASKVSPSVGSKQTGDFFAGCLSSIHMMMAVKFGEEDLAIDDEEAEKIAKAIVEVQKHYPTTVFNPKHAAILSLGMAVIQVEAPRAVLLVRKIKENKAKDA